jgi:hypothetical protein
MQIQVAKTLEELKELPNPIGSDKTLDSMLNYQIPATLKNYLERNFPNGVPDPLPPELAASVPRILLDPRLNELDPSETYYDDLVLVLAFHPTLTVEEARDWVKFFG